MIGCESDDNVRRIAELVERIEERSEVAIEAENLIVELARIWPIRVSDRVGRRQRDRQDVSLRSCAQLQRLEARRERTAALGRPSTGTRRTRLPSAFGVIRRNVRKRDSTSVRRFPAVRYRARSTDLGKAAASMTFPRTAREFAER